MNISNMLTQNSNWNFPDTAGFRKTRLHILYALSNILHPRVLTFMLSGIAIIFLTLLSSNNAIEIAISGIASVFIGIGVNNYSIIKNHLKEERLVKKNKGQSVHILRVTQAMIKDLNTELEKHETENLKSEIEKIDRFIRLGIQLVEEDGHKNRYPNSGHSDSTR
jgi:vacuolar-type H+-ATPase subunit F/Vma7